MRWLLPGLILLAGCGGATGPVAVDATPSPTVSTTAPSGPSSPARQEVRLAINEVAGVRIGTPTEEAAQELREVLGRPDTDGALHGCNGESGTVLGWGPLTVNLSDRASGPVLLSGWSVTSGESRFRYLLPYDTALGMQIRDVERQVPDASGLVPGEGPYAENYVVTTPRQPELVWHAHAGIGSTTLDEVTFQIDPCD